MRSGVRGAPTASSISAPPSTRPYPVFGSAPNFLGGDPILLEKVDGLHPDPALHETTIDVEPVTGANIQFKWQLQINLQVNQTSEFR